MALIGFDTEFFDSNESEMKVVAAVLIYPDSVYRFNLLDDYDEQRFLLEMTLIRDRDDTLVAHAVGAESRSLIALGYNPLDYKWIDTYAEFIMLCNSHDQYQYGPYLASDGNERYSYAPDPTLSEEEKELDIQDHSDTPKSLVGAAYKMLGVKLDQEQKTEMRDLILSRDLEQISARMDEILDYCESDTLYLTALLEKINEAYKTEGLVDFEKDQLMRGRYAACVGMSENLGIPINLDLLQTVICKTPEILESHKVEVNSFFPFFVPETCKPPKQFKNGKLFSYKPEPAHKDMSAYQAYITTLNITDFPKTKTGKFKSDKDTLEAWGYWQGLEALWKYNKTESSLKWFNKDNKNGFFDRFSYVDASVRPYFGVFGTQTGRNAAKAKTFPLAMSSWLRAIVRPKFGTVIISSDFSQQEVYVAAILSRDKNLYEAYRSGDVYLAFAKQAGLVPPNATKASHKLERMLCKSTVLGLQFGMGPAKLRVKLKLDSNQEISEEKTAELIAAHKETYQDYWQWVKDISREYRNGTPLITNDGWVLWCDNKVMTSVRNFPVQANAASITRLAVVRCWELGLKVMCSLHDAIYIISDTPEIDQDILNETMLWATEQILKEEKTSMRIDSKIITHDNVWVEEKGEKDWKKLKGFLIEERKVA